jgi:hypothetical protein
VSGYRATFDRIGRRHDVPDLSVDGSADRIAEQVYRYARPKLASRDVEVAVDLEDMSGTIFCGMQVGGHFTLTPADDPPECDPDDAEAQRISEEYADAAAELARIEAEEACGV